MNSKNTGHKHPVVGDVFMVNLDGVGSEQRGFRPCVVFQNNTGNKYSPNVIVLPITSSLKKINQPTHVLIKSSDSGLLKDSLVLCENMETVSKDRLIDKITTIPPHYMEKIAVAILLATAAIAFVNPDILSRLRNEAIELNKIG